MSIDLTEETYGRPPAAAGKPKPVPYLRLVHSVDNPDVAEEAEEGGRNVPFALAIAGATLVFVAALAWWLV